MKLIDFEGQISEILNSSISTTEVEERERERDGRAEEYVDYMYVKQKKMRAY